MAAQLLYLRLQVGDSLIAFPDSVGQVVASDDQGVPVAGRIGETGVLVHVVQVEVHRFTRFTNRTS